MKRIFKILTTALFICSVWILGGIEEVRAEEYNSKRRDGIFRGVSRDRDSRGSGRAMD